MRLISTIALFSITALATNHWNEGMGQYGDYQPEYQPQPTPQPVVDTPPPPPAQYEYAPPPPMMHDEAPTTTTVMMHETPPVAVEEPQMVHETETPMMHETPTTTTVMMHETAPAVVEEPPPPPPPMQHETTTVMMHETTTVEAPAYTPPPPMQEVDVAPPAEGPMTHTVTVGGDAGLVYTPSELKAAIGDLVHFVFHKQNHSVTQSTFDKPCNKLATGEDSGLLANPNNTVVPAPSWDYTVKEDTPTWWYCKQRTGTHCGKGMVFAINPTVEKSLNLFKEKAMLLNGTVTAPAPPPPEKTVTDVATTVTLISEPTVTSPPEEVNAPPTAPPPPPATDKPYTAPGWNAGGNPSACNCACFCGVGAFPQGDGWGSYGGMGGSMAAPW